MWIYIYKFLICKLDIKVNDILFCDFFIAMNVLLCLRSTQNDMNQQSGGGAQEIADYLVPDVLRCPMITWCQSIHDILWRGWRPYRIFDQIIELRQELPLTMKRRRTCLCTRHLSLIVKRLEIVNMNEGLSHSQIISKSGVRGRVSVPGACP